MGMSTIEKQIKDFVLTECHQEKVGIASIERFNSAPKGMHPTDYLPGCQSVIMFCTRLPDGALEELQAALPDTVINTTNPYGSSGDWRYVGRNKHPRYQLLCEQFDYSNYTNVSSSWYNDPMYYREGERRYRPQLWW